MAHPTTQKHSLRRKAELLQMVCTICGCTENSPCVGDRNVTCAWVAPEFCSACAQAIGLMAMEAPAEIPAEHLPWLLEAFEAMNESGLYRYAFSDQVEFGRVLRAIRDLAEPRVQLVSEGEANVFLRQLRMSAGEGG